MEDDDALIDLLSKNGPKLMLRRRAADRIAALKREVADKDARLAKLAPYEATLAAYDNAVEALDALASQSGETNDDAR